MAGIRAPKQWPLTKNETITSFEGWRQNLHYTLSLDQNFAPFLVDGFTWGKKTNAAPLRGLADDAEDAPHRRTAAQKVAHLDLMLGQIANFCPVISRNTVVKNSTSINQIWQAIRLHYGFQTSGAHFLDFNNIHLEPGERPEDLFQRLNSFVEDNLLKTNGNIRHQGDLPEIDEELTPSLENFIVLAWLRLVHSDLPALVKQRYCTELRSQTLASIKPEISQALDSLLDEINNSSEARILRTQSQFKGSRRKTVGKKNNRVCILCKQAGRPFQHFLSTCTYLPEDDRLFMTKVRQLSDNTFEAEEDEAEYLVDSPEIDENHHVPSSRRVCTKQSPTLKVFFNQYPLQLTLDTGAEISMIKSSVANYIGAKIEKTNQYALQADGVTPLDILGETHLTLSRGSHDLHLEALVVSDLDVDILAGIPFMDYNDIAVRPAKHQIIIQGSNTIQYGFKPSRKAENRVRRTAFVLRGHSTSTVIWPGNYIEVDTPIDLDPDCILAIEPRTDNCKSTDSWLSPHISESVGGHIRIVNNTPEPQQVGKNDHFCQVRLTTSALQHDLHMFKNTPIQQKSKYVSHIDTVKLDPDNILSGQERKAFHDTLCQYDEVFDPNYKGYNGSLGPFQACVNMGPVQPPQRKGRMPQYSHDKLVELQSKFDELEANGVFKRPEDIGVNVEYLNPSFLVKKPNGGHRLVTAFSDVGRYSKPQPSLMPDVDSTLRKIAQWKYIIVTDLTSAFYQIPLSKSSMKYCGVATPFKGVRVYTRCAMGMPGSETALEEIMCRVLGDQLQDASVAKLADDLYCGGNSPSELLSRWQTVLDSLQRSGIRLSASKTIICPQRTTILGWIWNEGKISASPHRIAVLSSCQKPENVRGLRSFIGAYKVLGRVLPNCSQIVSPLDDAIAGQQSTEKIVWSDELIEHFNNAQKLLASTRSITLPNPSDQLWIVTDGSVSKRGIGATLYITRDDKLRLAGFFSAKLRKHQVTWLPCEIEALCIAAAVKHFSPYIIQSKTNICVLTDSQPCVQAIEKLCRGEFSASPRVTSFLSTISRYQVQVRHLAGSENLVSDFASRNAPECQEPRCQICSFIQQTEDSVVRSLSATNITDSIQKLPFTTRSAWINIQSECPDLRRTHAHLRQGTRPSKKLTNIKDVKRYLNVASIAKDGLLVVKHHDPLSPPTEMIIIPREVLDGLVTALHIKLDHPTKHQLELVMKRHFYALDIRKSIERACDTCHTCASLIKIPKTLIHQTTESSPEAVGLCFAADVLKRNRQLVLVVRESVTSLTSACIIEDERHDTLRDNLMQLVLGLHPLDGPPAVIRVDPAPGFVALKEDETLKRFRLSIEIGRVKNPNKNPVAEKAIAELEDEILRQTPRGGSISKLDLTVAIARLNSRIRYSGLSAREMWTQRSQFTNEQLPLSDRDNISKQHDIRIANHPFSEQSKFKSASIRPTPKLSVGDLVYLYCDRDKTQARSRYIVTSIDGEWCFIKKFVGNQLRASSYKVKLSECYQVPCISSQVPKEYDINNDHEVNAYCESMNNSTDIEQLKPVLSINQNDKPTYPLVIGQESETPNIETYTPDEVETNINDIPHTPEEILGPSRPNRNRRPPKYLEDYVV